MQLEMVVGKIEELEKTLQFLSNLPKKFPTCRSFQLRLPTKRQPFKHEFMFFPENYFLLENSAYYKKPTKRLQSSSDLFYNRQDFCNIAVILDLRKSEVFETREETMAGRMQKR